ncbi:MAG: hypothetical protein KDH94_05605, partial [Coxiellaceae bacterium]|nr:hypothetical protein [Coxiellaceae bacterium]
ISREKKILWGLLALALLVIASYPIYAHQQVASRRYRVVTALKQLARRMNEYYSLQGDYKATPDKIMLGEIDKAPGYQLHIVRNGANHFTITATPVGIQERKDSACGVLSLTDSGGKYITGPGTVKDCWFL